MSSDLWCLIGGPVLALIGLVGRRWTGDPTAQRGARAAGLGLRPGSTTLTAMAWFLVVVGALAFLIGLVDVLTR